MVRRDERLADVELAHGAALRDNENRRDLERHHQGRQRIRDDAEAAGLHQHAAAQARHPGAGDDADRLVLAGGDQRGEILVVDRALDQRGQHVVGHIGDELDLVVLEHLEEVCDQGMAGDIGRGWPGQSHAR